MLRSAYSKKTFCLPHVLAMKRVIALTFFFFFVLFPSKRFDYLQITDSSSNIIGTYCGNQTGKSVRVVGTVAVLIFHTDGSVRSSGFELSFSFFSISVGEFSAVSTALTALVYSC